MQFKIERKQDNYATEKKWNDMKIKDLKSKGINQIAKLK